MQPRTCALSARSNVCGTRQPCRSIKTTAISASGTANLTLSIGETTVAFPLPAEEAARLQGAIGTTLQTFAEKQKAERPKRWPSMEYKFKGDAAARQVEYLEVFCNPNAHATAFDAKVLITLRSADGLRVTTEGKLSAIKAAVDECVAS